MGVRRGEVVIPPQFTDPKRGTVRCGAAALLTRSLSEEITNAGRILRVTNGPVSMPGHGGSQAGADGAMISVSYVDRRGETGGFAVAAHKHDPAAMAMAEWAAAHWAGALRSRRLLVADSPALCSGGRRALEMIQAVAGREAVFVVGGPVAARSDLAELARAGVAFAADLDSVPDGARVVLPAHGTSPGVRAAAAARNLRVIDGTCPLVAGAHADAAAYAARGDTVVVIGRAGNAALPALASQAGDQGVVVETRNDADAVAGVDGEQVSFVVDPGTPAEEAMEVAASLRQRLPLLAGHHFDVLCDAASDQVQSIETVAAASELVLVLAIDGEDKGIATALRVIGRTGAPARVVTDVADVRVAELADVTAIGLVSTLDAPECLKSRVVDAVAGLGPLTVRRRSVLTRRGGEQDAIWSWLASTDA
jgi:4-hydroxy-3-methylbut-2-enyl diphosphate reductase